MKPGNVAVGANNSLLEIGKYLWKQFCVFKASIEVLRCLP